MRKVFTYLFALVLFIACAMNDRIAPRNISESVFGFVKRNIQKDRNELFEDMKKITQEGLIHFEVYDEAGRLIATLRKPSDFNEDFERNFHISKMSIKSVSSAQLTLPTSLPFQD
ncbi:hypothetical protein [Roseivirga sp. 4D4]|uniref:hypothetical protein n=1 Tax=Roseivirga sp. 4D4 TaxID=1889784 RepID=UPI001112F1CC|nr:hypothetical protein [Roseivirga sp. 4D4]